MNLKKVQITEDYLLNCHHFFVVANISRAVSDQSLKSSVLTALKQSMPYEWEANGLSNITVVCTKSEVGHCAHASMSVN